jgi:hypothetical protein
VIGVCSTGSTSEDTSLVLGEDLLISFDRNGSGSLSDGGLEGGGAFAGDGGVTG